MKVSPKNLFLIDALGALLSTISLGVVLPYFHDKILMPKSILLPLATIAFVFFMYSLGCHLKLPQKWQIFLKGIAVANSMYCLLTTGLIIHFWQQLTYLGRGYFLAELVVIAILVTIEFKVAANQ